MKEAKQPSHVRNTPREELRRVYRSGWRLAEGSKSLKLRCAVAVLTACLGMNGLATAAILKGTAKNGTTGKPAAGDEVILISAAGAAKVMGRGRTDARGRFQFTVADLKAPGLVRVVHQGLLHQTLAAPGNGSVNVEVYDVDTKTGAVAEASRVQRFETAGGTLRVIEDVTVRNSSNPPRTVMNARPFEIQLPPGAELVSAVVQIVGGQPVRSAPAATAGKDLYSFPVPLYPGETRFGVAYRLPYHGEAVIQPRIVYPLDQLVIVLPQSMKFEAKTPGVFHTAPGRLGASVQETAAVKPGQPLAFRISGTGALAELQPLRQRGPNRGEPERPSGVARAQTERWFFVGALVLALFAVIVGILAQKRFHWRAFGSTAHPGADLIR